MAETPSPTKHSPLHHPLTRAGAVLTEVSGWVLPEHFGNAQEEARWIRSRVGLCDRSSLPKFELRGREFAAALRSVLGGVVPEPGRAALAEWGYACRLATDHALLVLDHENSTLPVWPSKFKSPAACAHLLDRTSGYGGLLVCGPAATDVLRKLTSLDMRSEKFPDLSCAAGPMAAIRVLLARKSRAGLTAYEIFFSREYGEYLWDAVMEAGAEFGMRPFGLAAARLL